MEDFDIGKVLSEEQVNLLKKAKEMSLPVVICGRQGPTGKTALKEYLRAQGVLALESWELCQTDKHTNDLCLLIRLGRLL